MWRNVRKSIGLFQLVILESHDDMMTVYDSVTKESLRHQPSHLLPNSGVFGGFLQPYRLPAVGKTSSANWGKQAMTLNDLTD